MKKLTLFLTLALLLTALLCIGIFTASAEAGTPCTSAAGCTGSYENGICSADATHYEAPTLNNNGTEADTTDDYYEIGNAGELYWFAALCNDIDRDNPDQISQSDSYIRNYYFIPYNAILTADITLNENVIRNGGLNADTTGFVQWDPIGFDELGGTRTSHIATYTGTLDGNGHTLSGLYFNDASASNVGLFAQVGESGTVKDLTVEDAYVHAERNCAILAYQNNGTVWNCRVDGIVSVGEDNSGAAGIACLNYGLIDGCINDAPVFGAGDAYFLGGICRINGETGTVRNSANFATIGASANYQMGGIACENHGVMENCYNHAFFIGYGSIGGIVAFNQSEGTVTNCYYDNSIFDGDAFFEQWGTATDASGKSATEFADGTVCALVGFHVSDTASCTQKATCETCSEEYFDTSKHTSEEIINGIRLCCGAYLPAPQKGIGANGMPLYEISNAGELYWFAAQVNKNKAVAGYPLTTRHLNAKLTCDITVNQGRFDETGNYTPANGEEAMPWVAIIRFGGDFDGNRKSISGLYLVDRGGIQSYGIGLFASLGEFLYQDNAQQPVSGRVRNLGITNSYFEGTFNVGSIAGAQYLGTCIENCWSDAFVKGGRDGNTNGAKTVGGLVGEGRGGSMQNCAFFGVITHEVTPSYANIIGAADTAYTLINSYSPYGKDNWHDAVDQPDYQNWYKSREAFASGEVAMLLNEAFGYHYFGQLLGTDQGPRIGGPAVYANVQLNCTEYGYANTPVGNKAHIPADAWTSDNTGHWHACTVTGCDEKLDATAHAHDNACDTVCNVCSATRTTAHAYDNACDTACNVCGATRTTAHVHDNACDVDCNVCGVARTVAAHADANEDAVCDACNAQLQKDGLSGGAGIGIGVGAGVVVMTGGFSLYWFVIKKKKLSDLL